MTVYKMDSCDLYAEDADIERRWQDPDNKIGSDITLAAAGGRFGDGAIAMNRDTAQIRSTVPSQHIILGFWWFVPSAGGWASGRDLVNFADITINVYTDGTIRVESDAGIVASTETVNANDSWYFVEMELATDAATGGSLATVRVNDVEWVTTSGGLSDSNATAVDIFPGRTSCTPRLDDIYILDATTSPNDSFLGGIRIGVKKPNADTANADFTPSGGGDNHDDVDDVPDDDDTSYVESSTVGHKDRYGYEAAPFSVDAVHAVQVAPVARDPSGGSEQLRSVIFEGATEDQGPTVGLPSTYAMDAEAIFDQNPDTGAAWTPTELDALEAGIEVV